jgi:glycosyltransferase involved in cell wall biosynthesis
MINVAFFSNQFAWATGHGIARYARKLFQGLAEISDIKVLPVATWSSFSTQELQTIKEKTGLTILPWGRKITPLSWTFFQAPKIETWLKEPIDITHIVSLGFPVATSKKLVITVHDIGPLTHPEYFSSSPLWLFKRSFQQMMRHADQIICVSQATADEVVGYSKQPLGDRLQVIHEGVDNVFFSQPPLDVYEEFNIGLPSRNIPFFLAAGAISPRKNIQRVLQAFQSVQDLIPHHLVLVGGTGWDSKEIFKMIQETNLSQKIHHLGYVSDLQLQSLYKYADFYIHPSLFEGFGLTILEAMAAECAVITSNLSSLPEVAGNAAILINPFSVIEIAEAIKLLATSDSMRNQLRERGLKNIERFTWSNTAEKVACLYKNL